MRRSASAGKASARTAADQRPPLLPPGVPPHAAEPLMSHCCSSKRCWRQATLTFERQPSTGSTVMRGEWASMGLQAAVEAIQAGLPACCHTAHGAPEHAPLEPPLKTSWSPCGRRRHRCSTTPISASISTELGGLPGRGRVQPVLPLPLRAPLWALQLAFFCRLVGLQPVQPGWAGLAAALQRQCSHAPPPGGMKWPGLPGRL